MSRKKNYDLMVELNSAVEKEMSKLADDLVPEVVEAEPEVKTIDKTVVCVKAAYLNVRNKPEGDIIDKLPDGTVITLKAPIKEKGEWTRIGEGRWVMSKFLK